MKNSNKNAIVTNKKRFTLTMIKRQRFSFHAPQQPKNEMRAMRTPATIITVAAEEYDPSVRSLKSPILMRDQAPTPTRTQPKISTQKA